MKASTRRLLVAAAAAVLLPVVPVGSATSSADPMNCENGWWDPWANTCRGPIGTQALDCPEGDWWNPVTNACEPFVWPST